MAPPTTRARAANWAVEEVTGLVEFWALVAEHRGIVGTCQMMRVCKASHAGGMEHLSTLPGLVVCGGYSSGGGVSDALRLDLATMRWEPIPALVTARFGHACCAVRGTLVVLGGRTAEDATTSVEMLSSSDSEEGAAFVDLPPLSCGGIRAAAAVAVEESDSAAGQVLLIGGFDEDYNALTTVQLVDLATGACAPQDNLLHRRFGAAAGRLPDGRVVCAGGFDGFEASSAAEVWGPPEQGEPDAAWIWRELPAMSTGRRSCCGCMMSDGRFAVLGGRNNDNAPTTSCEALPFYDGAAHWASLPPMHDARAFFACGVVARCVIAAGGPGHKSAELYDVELNRWLRLPCDLPGVGPSGMMGSAGL
jgi:hypothetical protein